MILYALICEHDHEFEAWFSSISDYDAQAEKGHVVCPYCQTNNVEKALMSPNVSTARRKEASAAKRTATKSKAMSVMNDAAMAIRKEIENNCDYVGDKFTDEALSMHYGETEERAIYGQASADQARTLIEEGVGIVPLPDILAPKPKGTLN